MSAKWKKGFDPKVILKKLSEIMTINNGESISFKGFEYHSYMATLSSMVELDKKISHEAGQTLITEGFLKAAKNGGLTDSTVLFAINKAIHDHNAKPDQSYYLLTTLNINISCTMPNFVINGCHLRFYSNLPRKFRKARREAISSVSDWLINADENSSYFLITRSIAKSDAEAGNNMLDAINLLRGIWNLQLNYSMAFQIGRNKPINQVTLGALHTLHANDGALVKNIFWYQPDYYKNHKKVNFANNSYKTHKDTHHIRSKIKKLNYGKEIESAIIRYTRALDSLDYNDSIIELWSLLEFLTSTQRDNYDRTINRILFLFTDQAYHKQVLEHLRQYRNRSVHAGIGQSNVHILVYQLKSYVEQLLWFQIFNPFRFNSLSETADFMDLKPDIDLLKKKILLYQAGVKFLAEISNK
ncbi:hypothetical protein [Nitrosomonas ureae]|uniref:hypothetical protein n=1 Tax=Nitrosomonas ureae TaxID=44577 RepID=UPI0011B1CE4F|nr:hypothetical protein [Nitrosomonas ureae]